MRLVLEHSVQEVHSPRVDHGQDVRHVLGFVSGKVEFEAGQGGHAGPSLLLGGSHDSEYLEQLVLVGCSGEQRSSGVHLGHDATGRPEVDGCAVVGGTQQNVRGSVPEGDDLVGESVDGNPECPRQTEISELEFSGGVDEQVLGFQVSMQNSVLVAVGDPGQELVHEVFYFGRGKGSVVSVCVHVLFEVHVHVLEDEHHCVFCVYNVVKTYDVWMFEFFHEGYFADSGGGSTFVVVEMDFFEGYSLVTCCVSYFSLVDGSICTFA